jgi:hypothetical protein
MERRREMGATKDQALQHSQLMSKYRVLCLESALRLE